VSNPVNKSFPCTSCALCCRSVGKWISTARGLVEKGNEEALVKEVAEFPYAINEDGSCSKLGQDNRCTVYDHRPDICSIEKTWEKHHKKQLPLAEYYERAAGSCNKMIKEAGLDEKFLVVITES